MAAHRNNFKTALKEKRTGKRKAPSHDILQKEEIIIQRLGTEVSGFTVLEEQLKEAAEQSGVLQVKEDFLDLPLGWSVNS